MQKNNLDEIPLLKDWVPVVMEPPSAGALSWSAFYVLYNILSTKQSISLFHCIEYLNKSKHWTSQIKFSHYNNI